jgi:NAD(P)-dependent dehydrogenase (short-subunit alcohol dehydrogenase family)
MEKQIAGARVLVVGASAGIGREAAAAFARSGANVVAVGRREEKLRELAEQVQVTCIAADITHDGESERIVSEALAALGGFDLVVNVAAASPMALLSDISVTEFTNVFVSNVIAPSEICRAVLPHVSESSIIAFVSSETVGRPRRGLVPYGASKAALEELVSGWRVEHPTHRFATVRVGATIGTDFGRDFGGDLLGVCIEDWIKGGHISAEMMNPVSVGTALAEVLAVAYLHPSVELTDFSLRPPGPLATMG